MSNRMAFKVILYVRGQDIGIFSWYIERVLGDS